MLRRDGFVSANGGEQVGELMTRLFKPGSGQKVFINAGAPKGSLAVEVLDRHAEPLDGFDRGDSISFTGDAIDYAVSWKERGSLGDLNG